MTDHTPTTRAYQLPDSAALSVASGQALEASEKALDRLGRVMAVVTAAGFRDVLADYDHDAPFDAAHAELSEGAGGDLSVTGRYWTVAGEERTLADAIGKFDADHAVFGINEWTNYLDASTWDVWHPLVTDLPDIDGRPAYRLDLVKAAALPLD
ncbi:hypothetical protein [Actinacidiphila sp. ITFR-21]|uniref:hypothetical protein n=1 Tax=Actinacidiphila sp. ITFR-21 TaxID=3075199 RepID=UPI00288A8B78|nr:hypothetical protein [Streptomyces sp. ITFR-21]WNI20387.1 hypothetical protein RLT57_32810 [Streptomyces sp. ITFR-21]